MLWFFYACSCGSMHAKFSWHHQVTPLRHASKNHNIDGPTCISNSVSLYNEINYVLFYIQKSICICLLVWPGFDDRPEYPSVQINSSSPCLSLMCPRASGRLSNVQSSRAWPLNMGGLVALAIMFF